MYKPHPWGEAEQEIVVSIRRVMLGLGSPPADSLPSGDPDVIVLDRRVNEAWKLRQGSHYIELGQMLPGLLVDAQVASQEMRGDQQAAAFGLLAHSYNSASSVLRKLGDDGLAVIAADRAVQAARTIGEPLLLAARPIGWPTPFCRPGESLRPRRSRCRPQAAWNRASTPQRRMLRPGVASC